MSQVDLRIALWNSNGILNHRDEIEMFIKLHKIDIMLISETHGTDRTYINIPGYKVVLTNHPANKAYGGSAIIIKNALNYVVLPSEISDAIQGTIVEVQFIRERVVIGSVYCRPRFNLHESDFDRLLSRFGDKFIIGGDYNAKHTFWGSRLSNPKGRELIKSISKNNVLVLSGGSPTYWPTDPYKTPDLIDFFMFKGISRNMFTVTNTDDLSSDHSPVLLTCASSIAASKIPKAINLGSFKRNLQSKVNIKIKLKSKSDIEVAVENLTKLIQEETEICSMTVRQSNTSHEFSQDIRSRILEKRRLRRLWQTTRDPRIKADLNRATKELKIKLKEHRDSEQEGHISGLSASIDTDYSLWKELKFIKRPTQRKEPIKDSAGNWIKNDLGKAEAFKDHLCNVFTPYSDNINTHDIAEMIYHINSPMPMSLELPLPTRQEVKEQIEGLNPKKACGPDKISARVIKSLPDVGITLLTYIFGAIMRLGHFPASWKVAEL